MAVKLTSVKNLAKGALASLDIWWRRNGATAMTIGGGAMTVVGTVLACKATLKVDKVLAPHEDEKKHVEAVRNGTVALAPGAVYTDQDYKKDILTIKTSTAKDLVKLYLPAGLTMIGGLCMIGAGHHMMQTRVAATAASLAVVENRLNAYRERVKSLIGEEEEELTYRGIKEEKETIYSLDDSDGNQPTEQTVTKYVAYGNFSPYAMVFDCSNPNWRGNENEDFLFIKRCQSESNDLFYINNGILFLNTVRSLLGFDPVKGGQVGGWVEMNDGTTDNYVDFGIFDRNNGTVKPWALDMYRREGRIIIDPNCDGDILDRVEMADL